MQAKVTDEAVRLYKEKNRKPEDELQRVIPGVSPWPIQGNVNSTSTVSQLPSGLSPEGNLQSAIEEFGQAVPMHRLAERQLLESQKHTIEMQLEREPHSSHRMGLEVR